MRTDLSLRFALLACALPALAACGGDDDADLTAAPADFSTGTGVPGETTVGAIPEDKVQAVCDAFQAYGESQITEAEAKRLGCTVQAAFASGALTGGSPDLAACQAAFNACEASPPDPEEVTSGDACTLATVPEDCSVTLDEFELCAQANVQAIKTAAANLSGGCSSIVANPDAIEAAFGTQPGACTSIFERCPSLRGD